MRTEIKKWGNSAVVRIPKPLLKECNLGIKSAVDMRVDGGQIIVEPIPDKAGNLAELLSRCPPEMMELTPEDLEWINAEPVGRERL